jgi:hypothetical protein
MMIKKHLFLFLFSVVFWAGAMAQPQLLPSVKLHQNEFPELIYPLTGTAAPLPKAWKYQDGNKLEYARANFDDSDWKTTEVGKELPGKGWRWYRLTFDLPETLNGKNLLLDLGKISVYDEIFLNGEKVGQYGNRPPYFLPNASHVDRKYPIESKHFKPGKNVLVVRVYLGYRGGLYEGNYTLQPIRSDSVVGQLSWKVGGIYSLERTVTQLAGRSIEYAPGESMLVVPRLAPLFGTPQSGQVTVKILNGQRQVIEQQAQTVPLQAGEWTQTLFQFRAAQQTGAYFCQASCTLNGVEVWREEVSLQVRPFNPLRYEFQTDPSLSQLENTAFPVQVSESAMGNLGPRELGANGVLFDDLEQTDARGSMTYATQFMKSLGAPRLFLSDVRPAPIPPGRTVNMHHVAGLQYDGLKDAWFYGFVRPNRAGNVKNLTVKNTSWAKRTYRYEYDNDLWMDFSISNIGPAWVATSNGQKLRVFEGIQKQHGIGLPTRLAYESNGQVKVVDAKKGIRGSDMSANWVLAWFSGGQGWDEFDTPYLFVLEKRPDLVQCYADTALFFSYPQQTGTVQGMPLYGVSLQRLQLTAGWAKKLPADVIERCRYWSQVLVNAPDQVTRTAQVDYERDQLTVKDEFTYLKLADAWNTKGKKIAPISPALALAAHARKNDVVFSKPLRDLQVAAMHGPLLAADDTANIVFRIGGLLHYVREVRDVKPPTGAWSHAIQNELNNIVQDGLEKDLKTHPWKVTYSSEMLKPGRQQRTYVNLLLTLPYIQQPLRDALEKEIRQETEKYFLYAGVPGAELKPHLSPNLRDVPAIIKVTNPVTQLEMGVSPATNKFGIDQPYWTSTNIYMVWLYAHQFNRPQWIKQNYATLKRYFNSLRNSHDWAICASWDSYGGLRVGNGLQEGSGKFAGNVAMARLAHRQGDAVTAHQAAYYAVMEALGMLAQVSASEFRRERRPWAAGSNEAKNNAYSENLRYQHYAEFNEFKGFSTSVIKPQNFLHTTGSYILSPFPESMRLYQEVWPQFTDDYYDPKYDAILGIDRRTDTRTSMDVFIYMTSHYPQTREQLFDFRKRLDLEWWDKLPDYRGYLDARGMIGYRKLW